jgi:hypothetical protein
MNARRCEALIQRWRTVASGLPDRRTEHAVDHRGDLHLRLLLLPGLESHGHGQSA